MNRDRHPGLCLLLAATVSLGAAPAALAQSGTSGSGNIAQTQYVTPAPQTSPPLVPVTSPPPDQGTLPSGPQSGGPTSPPETSPPLSDAAPDTDAGTAPDTTTSPATKDAAPTTSGSAPTRVEAGAAPASTDTQAAALPFTGGFALPLAVGGLLLLGAGMVLRRRTLV